MIDQERLTKEEVELKLQEKSEAISGRFTTLEAQMPSIPGRKNLVVKAIRGKKGVKLGLAVGAGLLVGALLFRRGSSRSDYNYGGGLDQLSLKLSRKIARLIENGHSADDAVRTALDDVPPVLSFSEESEGIIAGALKQLARSGTTLLATELSNYLKRRLSGDVEEDSEK